MQRKKSHINITLDSSILSWIDTLRGQNPRSTFINKILARFYSQTQSVFDWGEEGAKADTDIKKGNIHKFTGPDSAIKWLKS